MSIRLDPRRVNALKHLAGEAGVRPGDLVRQWVEERIDGTRAGAVAASTPPVAPNLIERLEKLAARVAALGNDTASRKALETRMLAEHRAESAKRLPEYERHGDDIANALTEARRSAGGVR